MRAIHFILDEKGEPKPIADKDFMQWAKWFEKASMDGTRRVAGDDVGEYFVSTVFMSLDHSFSTNDDVPPILYETMVFKKDGESIEDYTERYCTKEEALEGHKKIIELIKKL